MTIKEIISALRRCMFSDTLLRLAADTIEKLESENNRQKAEIKRQNGLIHRQSDVISEQRERIERIYAEAVKDCFNKVEQADVSEADNYIVIKKNRFDNLVKEMVGEC